MRWDKETSKVNPSADRKVMSIDPATGKPAFVVLGEMQDYISSLFKGVVVPTTVPLIVENVKYAYFAFELGVYENFLGIDGLPLEININEFGVFIWEGTYWSKHVVQVNLTDYMRISGLNSDIQQLNFAELKLIEDDEDDTLSILLSDGSKLKLNQVIDDFYVNADIVDFQKGDVVSAVSGTVKGIQLTDPNDPQSAKSVVGIVIDDIPVAGKGRIRKFGVAVDMSTVGFITPGQTVYVDPENPGKWIGVKPAAGTYMISVCRIIDPNVNSGKIDIKISCAPMLGDLSDVGPIVENIPLVKKNGVIVSEKNGIDIATITPASGTLGVNGDLTVTEKIQSKNLEIQENVTVEGDLSAANINSTGGFKKAEHTDNEILLAGGGTVPILGLKAGIYQLYNPNNNTQIVLSINAAGQVIIEGDIVQNGASYNTHAENINTPQEVITLREGAVAGLGIGELAGFIIKNYDGVNDGMISIDKDGVLRIGDVGDLQPVMTREETPEDYSPTFFNPITKRAETLPGATTKNDLVDADAIPVKDSEDGNKPKWWSWARIKVNMKAFFDGLYVALTGAQTIFGIKTFDSSPLVPNGATGNQAVNATQLGTAVIGAMPAATNALIPALTYKTRVDLDAGVIQSLESLTKSYIQALDLMDSALFMWDGRAGMKTRTVGANTYAEKAYNMGRLVQQLGAELVINSTFPTDTLGWSSSGATLSVDEQRLKVTTTSPYGFAYQKVPTTPGRRYRLGFWHINGSSASSVRVGTSIGGGDLYASPLLDSPTFKLGVVEFIAQTSSSYVRLMVYSESVGATSLFDYISVRELSIAEGVSDAFQTVELKQPFLSGLIAPNESLKLKGLIKSEGRRIDFSKISLLSPNMSTINFAIKKYNNELNAVIGLAGDSYNMIWITAGGQIGFRNASGDMVYSSVGKIKTGLTTICSVMLMGRSVSFFFNGEYDTVQSITASIELATLMDAYSLTDRTLQGELLHISVINKALSASEISSLHSYLRTQHPEIETVTIGGYQIASSNYEGTVVSDGTVIQEVQEAANVEKIPQPIDFSDGYSMLNGEVIDSDTFTTSETGGLRKISFLTVGKWYKLIYAGTSSFPLRAYNSDSAANQLTTDYGSLYFKAISDSIYLRTTGADTVTITEFSVEEIGWSGSTELYDAIYAQTTGTTEQKTIAALKAAAMWCYYNNDPTIGAWAGKLYNWYAVALINRYAPEGFHVGTTAEWVALSNSLGGNSVSGSKLKKDGVVYWGALNANMATNESGFSGIGNGSRTDAGAFGDLYLFGRFWNPDSITSVNGGWAQLRSEQNVIAITNINKKRGEAIRLFANTPSGDVNKTVEASTTINFASGTANFDVVIPWGHVVESVTVNSPTGITGLQCVLRTGAGADLETLFSAKTVVAGVQKTFAADTDQSVQRVDAVLRFNGVKADIGAPVNLTINLKKV